MIVINPPIPTKQTVISQLNQLNTQKATTCDFGNPGPGLRLNRLMKPSLMIMDLHSANTYINKQ